MSTDELIAVAREGKRALWRALAVTAESMTELQGVDYERLVQHSEEQQHRLEGVRLEVAKAALGASS